MGNGGASIIVTSEQTKAKGYAEGERKRKADAKSYTITSTLSDIETALRLAKGNVTDAADLLETTRMVLQRKIDTTPSLRITLKTIREELLDLAETKLREHVEGGNLQAVTFVLKTVGRNRGYGDTSTLVHEIEEGTIKDAAQLIEAMRKGAASKVKEIESKEYTVE